MSDGMDCICTANSESECCCGSDWTPQEVIDLRQQLASRDAEIAELVAAIKFWMKAEGNYDLMKADKMFQETLAKVRKP